MKSPGGQSGPMSGCEESATQRGGLLREFVAWHRAFAQALVPNEMRRSKQELGTTNQSPHARLHARNRQLRRVDPGE